MRKAAWLIPFAVISSTGCFATRNDVRLLQADIAQMKTQTEEARRQDAERARIAAAHSDSLVRELLKALGTTVKVQGDSIMSLADALSKLNATTSAWHRDEMEQLIAIQELMGQNSKTMADLRANLESGAVNSSRSDTNSSGNPPPLTMYRLAKEQLDKGAPSTARATFEELIRTYPADTIKAAALFGIGESYSLEHMDVLADSMYAEVVKQFPKSSHAPNALYKRAFALEKSQPAAAKRLYQQLIREYKSSREAINAQERLRNLPPG